MEGLIAQSQKYFVLADCVRSLTQNWSQAVSGRNRYFVIPDDGEASGKRADSRATDEFKGCRLSLRVSRRNRLELLLPTFSVWLTPNACGITQISLLLATPGGQRSWANESVGDKTQNRPIKKRRFSIVNTPHARM